MELITDLKVEGKANHKEVSKRLKDVEEQVKYTNGQVRALNTWKIETEAVDKYKSMNPQNSSTVKVETNTSWDWKTVLTIILTLATAITAVVAGLAKS